MVQHQVQVDSDGISDGIEPVESADACYHMVNAVTDVVCIALIAMNLWGS